MCEAECRADIFLTEVEPARSGRLYFAFRTGRLAPFLICPGFSGALFFRDIEQVETVVRHRADAVIVHANRGREVSVGFQ